MAELQHTTELSEGCAELCACYSHDGGLKDPQMCQAIFYRSQQKLTMNVFTIFK